MVERHRRVTSYGSNSAGKGAHAAQRGVVRRAAARPLHKHVGSRRVRTNAMLGIEFSRCSSSTQDKLKLLGAKPGKVLFREPAFIK